MIGFTRGGWEQIVELALAEDVGTGDITTLATVPITATAEGVFLMKSDGVISGLEAAAYVFARVDPAIVFAPRVADGAHVAKGEIIADVRGPARGILTGERVALNLLQRLSGVATLTTSFVAAVAGTHARVVDTRKTTPGMRMLEKAAVRHGGGHNHRVGLADGVLIKDNHLAAVGGADRVTRAIQAARALAPHTLRVEVEVTTLAEADEAVAAGADIIMLDNMTLAEMAEAVRRIDGRALVDLISAGALTHSAPSIDISLDFALR